MANYLILIQHVIYILLLITPHHTNLTHHVTTVGITPKYFSLCHLIVLNFPSEDSLMKVTHTSEIQHGTTAQ